MAQAIHDETSVEPTSRNGILKNGVALGIIAAVAYSLANLALRHLSDATSTGGRGWDLWVTAMKTVPTGIVAWVLVLKRLIQKEPAFPPLRLLPILVVAALVMQFGGNLCFQISLSHLGLGITVPLVFASILCVGAIMGRVFLGDPITRPVVTAMGIMIVAIVMLSAGTMPDSTAPAAPVESGQILIGICIAAISGCSYGAVGVLIRNFVRTVLTVESMLIVFSTVGGVLLAAAAITMSGWQTIQDSSVQAWPMLLAAGTTNAIAFFAVAHALRVMDVNRMNVINASQNAMCAVGAVVLFQEQLSALAVFGIALTIAGLIALGWKRNIPVKATVGD